MQRTVRVQMLGQLRAVGRAGTVAHFETRRSALLLAFLASHPGRQHAREALAEMLWPDEDPEVTRVRFRQVLAGLRRSLEPLGSVAPDIVLADGTFVQGNASVLTTDAGELEQLLRRARDAPSLTSERAALLAAVELYGGELLPGFYEDWISLERTRLAGCCGDALLRLVELALAAGAASEAVEHALQAVRLDPLREQAHGALIRALVSAGRRGDAQRQFRELERMLREEFGAQPPAELHAILSGPSQMHPPRPAARPSAGFQTPGPAEPEPVGGAVPLSSPYYVTRPADGEFAAAVRRRDSIVLVKGPRQVGKTSLLARGIGTARLSGARVLLTDFQKLPAADVETADALFRALALSWCDQLELETSTEQAWSPLRSWAANWERFVRREVLRAGHTPLLWALDEVDRLFSLPYVSEVFGLFRSWHNERSLDPGSPWSELTLAIAYATEAHLFISDLNQSPFNVGTRVSLEDFTPDQVVELNRRHGGPLRGAPELQRFLMLAGGHPYLVRKGLYELAAGHTNLEGLCARAAGENGPFGDHLRRLRLALASEPELTAALVGFLRNGSRLQSDHYYRLHSAGVLAGDTEAEARPRCGLYAQYLAGLPG